MALDRKPLDEEELAAALQELPGWGHDRGYLKKEYRCKDFREALAMIVRIGFEAEAMDHHPKLTNVYSRIAVALTTHDADGRVTAHDVELARRIEALFAAA